MDQQRARVSREELSRQQDMLARQLAFRQRTLGDDHPGTLRTLERLAVTLEALGSLRLARGLRRDVLAGVKRVFGERSTESTLAAHRLAMLLAELGEAERLKRLMEHDLRWLAGVGENLLGRDLLPVRAWVIDQLAEGR
ncbi:MAG: tetratricopeptide repeat protein [Planctomycetota bacterium]